MTTMADSESHLPNIPIGTMLGGFQVVEKISSGGCGVVFVVKSQAGDHHAMKVESDAIGGGSAIKLEVQALHAVKNECCFPEFIASNRNNSVHYIVMSLLGSDLHKLHQSMGRNFSPGTWSRVGMQALYSLKTFHDCGWTHRDVKPANFAMGLGTKSRLVSLFDFGMAREIVEVNKKQVNFGKTPREDLIPHRRQHWKKQSELVPESQQVSRDDCIPSSVTPRKFFRKPRGFVDPRGTPGLMSLRACQGLEHGRCDDVWSLMYTLILFVGNLPWIGDEQPKPSENLTLRELFHFHTEIQFKEAQLKQLEDIDKMLKACDYYSFPNYQLIYEFLLAVMQESGVTWNDPYDWEQKNEAWRLAVEAMPTAWKIWEQPGGFFEVDFLCSVLRRND